MKAWHKYAVGALLAAAAVPAEAQFTTAVIPPARPRPAEQPMVAADTTRRDTTVAARLTDMKAWVDSAAGVVAVRPPADSAFADTAAITDTLAAGDTTARVAIDDPVGRRASRPPTRQFREGAPAPDTASPLALLALLGLGSIVAGAALRRR